LAAGSSFTMNFAISGVDQAGYASIPPVNIKIDSKNDDKYKDNPVAEKVTSTKVKVV
jgi:hypothetical protein